MVTTKDGCKRNGNLRFTIRPIQAALQQDYDRQMQKLDEDAARRSLKQHKNRGYREKGRSNAAAGPAAKTVLETESA